MNYRKQFLAGATAFLLVGMAHASQVIVTFTGIITDSWDMTGSTFGTGQGYNTLRNKTVVQEFTFDSTVPPSRLDAEPLSAVYTRPFSPTTLSASWIDVKTTIDGSLIVGPTSETPGSDAYSNIDSLTITDGYRPGSSTTSGVPDYLYIDQGSVNVVHGATSDFHTRTSSVVSVQKNGNFIEGVNLDQQFALDFSDGYFVGSGNAHWSTSSVTRGSSIGVSEGYVNYLVKAVTYRTVSSVPEPSTSILLLVGMTALGAVCRNAATRHKT